MSEESSALLAGGVSKLSILAAILKPNTRRKLPSIEPNLDNSRDYASPGDCDAFLGNGQVSKFVKITVIGILGTRKSNGVTRHGA